MFFVNLFSVFNCKMCNCGTLCIVNDGNMERTVFRKVDCVTSMLSRCPLLVSVKSKSSKNFGSVFLTHLKGLFLRVGLVVELTVQYYLFVYQSSGCRICRMLPTFFKVKMEIIPAFENKGYFTEQCTLD